MGTGMLIQGAFVKPPVGATETATTTSASASVSLWGSATPRKDTQFSFICDQNFNLEFDTDSTPPDPSANYMFAANTLYSFGPGSKITHFKVRSTAAGTLKWWRSTQA
jgi:hypothetical protein